jgi:hypothetical protein
VHKTRAATLAVLALLPCLGAQNQPSILQNDRLKTVTLPDSPVVGGDRHRVVAGFWLSESKQPQKVLGFLQQVSIECRNYADLPKECVEISVTIAPEKRMVSIQEIGSATYDVNSWDSRGLVASYGGGVDSLCVRHRLTMDFSSGAVSLSHIPIRTKGCEALRSIETDSYRLVRGNYYVDTTPGNDVGEMRK